MYNKAIYNNDLQLEAFFQYIRFEVSKVGAVFIKPQDNHIIDRANMRGYDSSLVAKVVVAGIKQNIEFLKTKVKERKHSITLNYKDLSVILKVMCGERDQRLLFFIRTCYCRDDDTKRTVHQFEVTL